MIPRFFEAAVRERLASFPVVAVIGPRQVGKSTLVAQPAIARGRTYLTLDDIAARSAAQTDPRAFLSAADRLTIDEVQLAPGLLREIKLLVDRDRRPGRFLLTGSADLDHCADLSAALAGRVGIVRLPAITASEAHGAGGWRRLLEARNAHDLDAAFAAGRHTAFPLARLLTGGFPASLRARSGRERTLWMESFRTTYLERDLRRISDIGNLADFSRLMQLAAATTGSILNQAHLARDAGMSPATAGRHLSILEASLLLVRLPPFFTNVGKRLVKSPKLFWADTGLAAHLLGIHDVAALAADATLRGRLFETFVMMELLALLPLVDPVARLHHLRTHDHLEVDGLVEIGRRRILLEIKAARTVTAADARPLERWLALTSRPGSRADSFGAVIHAGSDYHVLSERVRAVPAAALFCR